MAGARAIAGVLVHALGAGIAAIGAGRGVVRRAHAGAVAGVCGIAFARGGVTTGRARGLEAIVLTRARAVAGILVDALGPRVAAVRPRSCVVRLAHAGP